MTLALTPTRHRPGDPALADVLALIRREFAYMDGRIDPPSSMHRLSPEEVSHQCEAGEVWSLVTPPVACMFLTPKPGRLYLGKLAVDGAQRGRGLAARLVALARERALALGYGVLELQTRIELTENHAAFARMGFVRTAETAHEGYARPTSITMQMRLA